MLLLSTSILDSPIFQLIFQVILFIFNKLIEYYKIDLQKNIKYYQNKRILIIGGTQGLGLSLAILLRDLKADVTILAREKKQLDSLAVLYRFKTIQLDINRMKKVHTMLFNRFDIIFYCVGKCYPGYIDEIGFDKYKESMKLNCMGFVNFLHNIISLRKQYNEKNIIQDKENNKFIHKDTDLRIIVVSSTSLFFQYPGYSAYIYSKSALYNFCKSVQHEIIKYNITLKVYHSSTIKSRGLEQENIAKPKFCKKIESFDLSKKCPFAKGMVLLDNLFKKRGLDIFSDDFCYITKISSGIDSIKDLILSWWFGGVICLLKKVAIYVYLKFYQK